MIVLKGVVVKIAFHLCVGSRATKFKFPLLTDGRLTASSLPPLVPLVTGDTCKSHLLCVNIHTAVPDTEPTSGCSRHQIKPFQSTDPSKHNSASRFACSTRRWSTENLSWACRTHGNMRNNSKPTTFVLDSSQVDLVHFHRDIHIKNDTFSK